MTTSALGTSVLVLNRSYLAVHIVNVRRAFSLVLRDLAEIIHIEDGRYDFSTWREISELRATFEERDKYSDWIRAVNFEIEAPRIIRLLYYNRMPKQRLRLNRRNIFARDANRCQYCDRSYPTCELSFDHVVPRSQGGDTTWNNIVTACIDCNVRKGGRTPKQAGMKLIRKPVKPKHSPLLAVKLGNPKYESWKTFLAHAYWSVDLQ